MTICHHRDQLTSHFIPLRHFFSSLAESIWVYIYRHLILTFTYFPFYQMKMPVMDQSRSHVGFSWVAGSEPLGPSSAHLLLWWALCNHAGVGGETRIPRLEKGEREKEIRLSKAPNSLHQNLIFLVRFEDCPCRYDNGVRDEWAISREKGSSVDLRMGLRS